MVWGCGHGVVRSEYWLRVWQSEQCEKVVDGV